MPTYEQPRADSTHRQVRTRKSDASQDKELSVLIGFVGVSNCHDRLRVYGDVSGSYYCDVAKSDVVSTAPVDVDDENSPTVVWVDSAVNMEFVGDDPLVTGAVEFLSGPIHSGHFRLASYRAAKSAGASGKEDVRAQNTQVFFCGPAPRTPNPRTTWGCPIRTLEGACETRNIYCPQ